MLTRVQTEYEVRLESLHIQRNIDLINEKYESKVLDSDKDNIDKFEPLKKSQEFLNKNYKWAHISCINLTPNIKFCDDDQYAVRDQIQDYQKGNT